VTSTQSAVISEVQSLQRSNNQFIIIRLSLIFTLGIYSNKIILIIKRKFIRRGNTTRVTTMASWGGGLKIKIIQNSVNIVSPCSQWLARYHVTRLYSDYYEYYNLLKIYSMFGSAPYSGLSSSIRPSYRRTALRAGCMNVT